MTNWAAIGIVTAVELAVLFGATIRSFSAKGRLDRERDNDIRAAIAGYEAGRVIPALANLVGNVIEVRRPDEPVDEALTRADTDDAFKAAVDAAVKSRSPRAWERTLIRRYTTLGVCLVACHLSGPAVLYNVLTPGYNFPRTAVIVAAMVFSLGVLGTLISASLAGLGEISLARAIRDGKDAAPND